MSPLGILFALASATVWGAGDFAGGIASRRLHHFQVVALSAGSGIVILLICWILWAEPFPAPDALMWAVLAGASGVFGIAALYRGLSLGNAALVAPTAGVVGALLPVLFGIATDSWPSARQLAGFASALAGIWLVAQSSPVTAASAGGLRIAILAGLGLGGFLVLIAQVPSSLVFGPLTVARVIGLVVSTSVLIAHRLPVPGVTSNPIAVAAGVLDAGGTIFYAFARQYTRLDVAAVLSSMYPVVTVLLARFVLEERITRAQAIGVALCLLAVALVAG